MRRALKFGILVIILHLSASHLWAARIFVPDLELFIRANFFNNGSFRPGLDTLATLNIDIAASDKIGVRVRVGHTGNISEGIIINEQLFNQLITLKLISLTVGEPFVDPVYVEVFSGEHDKIGSGEDFERFFNIDGIASFYRGYFYFGDGALYDALHAINGTGLVLASEFGTDFASARFYLYREATTSGLNDSGMIEVQDAGAYSTDLRAMFDIDIVQIDVYFGATINTLPNDTNPPRSNYSLRTGIMANFGASDELFQFFIHFGIPYLVEVERAMLDNLSISHFQVLAEARFNIEDAFGLHFTFLVRPFYYNNVVYSDPGVDFNAKLFFGSYSADLGRGGFDIRARLNSDFSFRSLNLIPFFGFTAGGIIWDFGGELQVLPFDLNQFLDSLSIGISAKAAI